VTPYYEDEQIQIWHGRWQDVLPAIAIDSSVAVITDPPYGTGGWRRPEAGNGSDPSASLIVEDWDDGAIEWIAPCSVAALVLTFWPAARTSKLLAAADAADLTKHRAVYLRKPDPKPQVGGRISWSCEPVWALSRDGVVLYGKSDWHEASAPRVNRNLDATGHPYQKPTSAMKWLVAMTKQPIILDPFMGSGTTLLAAKTLGRRAIGIEQDEAWCAATVSRLQQSVMDLGVVA